MDLDEMKQLWNDQDPTLDKALRLNARLVQAPVLRKAKNAMTRLSLLLWMELLINVVCALWMGSFLWDHRSEPRFFLPAAVLHLGVILLLSSGVHQLAAIGNLDFGAPIVAIQRRMESLRMQRLRVTQLTLLASPLLWLPLLIVVLKGFFDLDAYAIFSKSWLIANGLFGLAVIPAAIWISRRYAERMAGSPLVQRLLRDMAGYNLNAAAGFLSTLARFEEERA
jgi:hypothetical protein